MTSLVSALPSSYSSSSSSSSSSKTRRTTKTTKTTGRSRTTGGGGRSKTALVLGGGSSYGGTEDETPITVALRTLEKDMELLDDAASLRPQLSGTEVGLLLGAIAASGVGPIFFPGTSVAEVLAPAAAACEFCSFVVFVFFIINEYRSIRRPRNPALGTESRAVSLSHPRFVVVFLFPSSSRLTPLLFLFSILAPFYSFYASIPRAVQSPRRSPSDRSTSGGSRSPTGKSEWNDIDTRSLYVLFVSLFVCYCDLLPLLSYG